MNALVDGSRRQYSFLVRVEYTGRVKALYRSELCQDHGQRPASGPVTVQSEGVNESPSGEDLAQGADKLEPVSDKRVTFCGWLCDPAGSHEVECGCSAEGRSLRLIDAGHKGGESHNCLREDFS